MTTTTMTGAVRSVMITWEPERRTWQITYHELCASTHNGGLTAEQLLRDLKYHLVQRETQAGPDFSGPPPWKT
jgi:hypothetical protein